MFGESGVGGRRLERFAEMPDAQSRPPEGHKALVRRETVAEVPLTGVSFILRNSFP